MWSKEQIAKWKQGKFTMAERKEYLAWRKAGKPEFQEPKPQADPNAPQQGPAPYDYEQHGPGGTENQPDSILSQEPTTDPVEEAPAELAVAGPAETWTNDDEVATAESGTSGANTWEDDPDDNNLIEQWASDAFDWAEGTEFGDFIINDVISYIDQGLAQRAVAGETAELLLGNYSSEDVEEYIAAVERMNAQEQTEEQNAFNAEIEANGGGFWGTIKAAYHNPSATTGIMITSMIAMTTPEAVGSGLAVAGTVTAGASVGGPIGTVLGAIGGSAAGLGTVSAITDATLTFNDYMQTQLRESGKEFNQENIQALLNDPEKIKGLRAAAAARGIAIGVIDALTFKLGSAIAKPLTTTLGRGAGALTGTVVEGIGGAAGEAAGQGAEIVAGTREDFDTTEITLEGIAEVGGPGTVLHVAQTGVDVKNTVVPTADTKPSADLSTLTPPTAEAVNEVEATGIITEEQTPEAAAVDIKRVAVKEVNAGLEAEGVTIENATPEQIEAVIPRIQEKIVNTLKENGIIKQDVDINAPEVTALIKRVAIESVGSPEASGVQTEDTKPTADPTINRQTVEQEGKPADTTPEAEEAYSTPVFDMTDEEIMENVDVAEEDLPAVKDHQSYIEKEVEFYADKIEAGDSLPSKDQFRDTLINNGFATDLTDSEIDAIIDTIDYELQVELALQETLAAEEPGYTDPIGPVDETLEEAEVIEEEENPVVRDHKETIDQQAEYWADKVIEEFDGSLPGRDAIYDTLEVNGYFDGLTQEEADAIVSAIDKETQELVDILSPEDTTPGQEEVYSDPTFETGEETLAEPEVLEEEIEADIPRIPVKTVNQVESSGIVAEGVEIETAIPQIQRIAVRSVLVGLEAEGVKVEDITPEIIEENIPRIGVETVSELQEQGIISPDVKPEAVVPVIQRIAVDTVNEIKAQAAVQQEVNIAHRDVTAEINAPRLTQEVASEIEATGVIDINTPAVQAAIETIPNIVIEEIKGDGATTVESVVEKTVNAITEKGVITEDQPIEVLEPVIRRIAQHTVNELTPGGVVVTPLPEIITEVLNAEAVNPAGTQVTIGPNNDPISDQEVETFVENATDEELVEANIQVNNDPVFEEWITDKVTRAAISIAYAPIGLTVDNKDRIVDLEVGLTRYEDNDTTVGKAIKTEINRRIKNIAMGKPEMDGIITEATEGKPAQNNSILGDESFAPIKKPIKPKAEPKIKPSLEETKKSYFDRRRNVQSEAYSNPDYLGEMRSYNIKGNKVSSAKANRAIDKITGKTQAERITEAIANNQPEGNQFYSVGAGTSPQTLNLTKKIARKYGLEVTQHPLNPGEFLVHRPEADFHTRESWSQRIPGQENVPYGVKQAIQFFTERTSKNKNSGLREDQLRKFATDSKSRLAGGKSGLIQDAHTLSPLELEKAVQILEEQYAFVEPIYIEQQRSGETQITTFIEFANEDPFLSLKEHAEPSAANKSFLNKAVKALKRAFPKVEVVYGYESYVNAYKQLTMRGVEIPVGTKGFVFEGKVYLDPLNVTKDTAFHEYAHLWIRALRIENPLLWKRMKELLKGTEYARIVGNIPYYRGLTEDAFMEEVAANAFGKRAAVLFEASESSKWRKLLQDFTDWLKYKLNIGSQLGYTDLTLEEIINIGAKSILTGDNTAYDMMSTTQQQKMKNTFAASVPEGYPDYVTKADIANASAGMRKLTGLSPAKIRKSEEWRAELIARATDSANRRLAKEEANATGKKVEALSPELQNPVFKKLVKLFEDLRSDHAKSWSRSNGAAIMNISPEKVMRSLGKIFQDFESGESSVQQFMSAAGGRANPRKPDGVTATQFRKEQYGVGALILEFMIETGVLDLDYSYRRAKADRKLAKKRKEPIPATAGYVVVIKDQAAFNGLADAVATYPSKKPDFKEVFVGEQKPKKQDSFRGKDGLQLVARDLEINRMTRETHPKVFEVKDKADATRYTIDTEYVGFLKKLMKNDKFREKMFKGKESSVESQERLINTALQNMERIGTESFGSAHNFVHNGRLMNTSTDVSHQSSKNILAAYSFENKEAIGESGWEFIRVLTQDTFGYSGRTNPDLGDSWADRLAAADQNQKKWMEVAADPMGNLDYILEADVPMLFLRHILEMKNALATEGGPQNFKSGLPAHMDATTSGIQILAAVSKDGASARIANLTKTDERLDSYSLVVAKVMEKLAAEPFPTNHVEIRKEFMERKAKLEDMLIESQRLREDGKIEESKAKNEERAALKEQWKPWFDENKDVAARSFWFEGDPKEKLRKIFKGPVMTKYYSSTVGGMSDALMANFKDTFTVGEGDAKRTQLNPAFTSWLASKIYKGADSVFKGPKLVMETMVQIAKDVHAADKPVVFTNPVTGFKIVNDPKVTEGDEVEFNYYGDNEQILERNSPNAAGTRRISSKIAVDGQERKLSKQKSQIAPLVVHSLDASLVHYVFLNANYPVQTIHDSFATTPAHAAELYKSIRQGFYEVTKGDGLLRIIEEIYQNAGYPDWKARAAERYDQTQYKGSDQWVAEGVLENQYAFSAGVTDPDVAAKTLAKALAQLQPKLSLAESFEGSQIDESISLEANKIEIESKPCK